MGKLKIQARADRQIDRQVKIFNANFIIGHVISDLLGK